MSVQTYTEKLTVQVCCNCGMVFGVQRDYDNRRREDHKSFCCPAGHWQSYTGKTKAQRLKRQLDNANRRAASAKLKAENAEFRRRAAVGQVTKIKNRISKGVCPCCKRTFVNLARHMGSQHPDYAE